MFPAGQLDRIISGTTDRYVDKRQRYNTDRNVINLNCCVREKKLFQSRMHP